MEINELSRYLFLSGAAPFLFLGTAHALATPFEPGDRKGLSPSDPAVSEAMGRAHPLMTRRTNIWLAWVGFNLSHSLGAVAFGVFVVILGRDAATFQQNAWVALPCSLAVAVSFTVLAAKYWFKTPLRGCLFSTSCFLASSLLRILA